MSESIHNMNISTLIGMLQNAVIEAGEVSNMQFMRTIAKYFDSDGKALTKEIKIPGEDGTNTRSLNVPLFCLIPFSAMKIEKMEVEFETCVTGITEQTKDIQGDMEIELSNIESLKGTAYVKKEDEKIVISNNIYHKNEETYKSLEDTLKTNKNKIKKNKANMDLQLGFESTEEMTHLPKMTFKIEIVNQETPEAVMKLNDSLISKFFNI